MITKAKVFAEVVQETVINEVNHKQTEFKSVIKEDFYKIEIKMEQLNSKIESTKVDLIKWFVGLFFALALMIIGLYIKK
jgi:Protein of unknown function (DUF1640)